jgi:hypothetical protein
VRISVENRGNAALHVDLRGKDDEDVLRFDKVGLGTLLVPAGQVARPLLRVRSVRRRLLGRARAATCPATWELRSVGQSAVMIVTPHTDAVVRPLPANRVPAAPGAAEHRLRLQRAAGNAAVSHLVQRAAADAGAHDVLRSAGRPLPTPLREDMERVSTPTSAMSGCTPARSLSGPPPSSVPPRTRRARMSWSAAVGSTGTRWRAS